jgi:hypothetical protein
MANWSEPSRENEAAASEHLTFAGTRDQYIANVWPDVAARIPAESWEEGWRVMSLSGRMDTQRALIADYGRYVARFNAITEYLAAGSSRRPTDPDATVTRCCQPSPR